MPENNILLTRLTQNSKQTTGILLVHNSTTDYVRFSTIELPWLNNKKMISCIPPGTYTAKKIKSYSFGWCIQILDVPNRTAILIHAGNFYTNTKGCILVGEHFGKINKDSEIDISNSRKSVKKLLTYFPSEKPFTITIRTAISIK